MLNSGMVDGSLPDTRAACFADEIARLCELLCGGKNLMG
jgi:hypothetical protein